MAMRSIFCTRALDKQVSLPDTTPMPDLSTYSDSRLTQYLAFCAEQSYNYSEGTTAKWRTRYRREAKRVERYMDTREPVAV